MPCRQHLGPGAVDLVQALAPGKMQTPRNLGDTGRRLFRQSALQGEADFGATTPRLNSPIIAMAKSVAAGSPSNCVTGTPIWYHIRTSARICAHAVRDT